MDSFTFIHNRVFDTRCTAFAPQAPQRLPGASMFDRTALDTGAKVQENGDVYFGYYAPEAKSVSLVFGIRSNEPIPMEKGDDGVWRFTLPYSPTFCGPKAFQFRVDGVDCVSAYCSQYYSHSIAINYVEIPDPNAPFVLLNDVPHGSVSTEYFWSNALQDWTRCLVYTPPMYHEGGEYPVFYLQHGSGENETSWVYDGKANFIMDNLIAEGKAVPCIIVMNDGMVRLNDGSPIGRDIFTQLLVEDCMPMIEKKYRVKADKWHRAIAGFSMGSMQACITALTHPELFAYVGLFSGFMRHLGPVGDKDKLFENHPHLSILEDRERFVREYKLFFRAWGSDDPYRSFFEADDEICREHGYDQYPNMVRMVLQDYPHDWAIMRVLLHDFAQRLFR